MVKVSILARAKRLGVALVDHEKMRVFEYHLGELSESSALFEGAPPHRDRQHGWNVSSSPSGSGDAAAQWASAGTHVDRRELATAERHFTRCAAALANHVDEHPVDHLLLGGPTPEPERLERLLPTRYRSRVVGFLPVRVTAPLEDIQGGRVGDRAGCGEARRRGNSQRPGHGVRQRPGHWRVAVSTRRAVRRTGRAVDHLDAG